MSHKDRLLYNQENADRGVISEVVSYSQFHLQEVLDEVFAPFFSLAKKKNTGLRIQYGAHLPKTIVADKQKIRWVLEWMTTYALSSVHSGEVSVLLHIDRSDYDHPELAIMVKYEYSKTWSKKQDGSENDLPAGPDSTGNVDKGNATGIDKVRSVVELMGGKCMVHRVSGEGGHAFFTVPLMPVDHSDLSDHDDSDYLVDEKEVKILVVEDDFTNRFYLAGFLKSKGWFVDTADNGVDAIEKFKPGKYNLIIMDGQMPVMDGFAAARKIREAEGRQTYTPILAISGYAIPEDRERFTEAGMDDFLAKPIDEIQLLHLVGKLTGKPSIG